MIPIFTSDRYCLGTSFTLFAIVGVAHAAFESLLPTLGATVLAVAGVYGVARYAGRVSRRRLATTAIGLWLAFLAGTVPHAVGVGAVTAAAPVAVVAVSAFTWATLLSAASTTVFLGFREYGSTTDADVREDGVLDGDSIR